MIFVHGDIDQKRSTVTHRALLTHADRYIVDVPVENHPVVNCRCRYFWASLSRPL